MIKGTIKYQLISIFLLQFSLGYSQETGKKLDELISIALEQSIDYQYYKNKKESNYWRYYSFKKSYLPSLALNSSLPGINRNITKITLPDGKETFVNQNQTSYSSSFSLEQIIPFTGGKIFVTSSLNQLNIISNPNLTSFQSTPIAAGIYQPLFGFNQYKWQSKIEPLILEESKRLFVEEKEILAIKTCQLYFDVIEAGMKLSNNELNYLNSDTIYRISKGRYSLGKIPLNELLQMELSVLKIGNEKEISQLNYEFAKDKLRLFLKMEPSEKLNLSIDTIIPNYTIIPNQALDHALNNKSDLIAMQRAVTQAEIELVKLTKDNRFNINLAATYGLTQSSTGFQEAYNNPLESQSVNLGIDIPLVNWGYNKGKINQAHSTYIMNQNLAEQKLMEFKQEVLMQVKQFNLMYQQVQIAKKTMNVAEQSYQVLLQRFSIGKANATILELNNAMNIKDQSIVSYVGTLRAFWMAHYKLRMLTHYDFIKQIRID